MSIGRAKTRLVEILESKGEVSTHDLEHDIALQAESPEDVKLAAHELEAEGAVILFRETMAPRGLDFTGMTRLS
jgi:transcriptional regulator of NAD metabolism